MLRYFYNHIVENQKKNNLQCTMKTEWVHKKLGDDDVAKIIMGQSPSSASYNDENIGLPFLQGCADFGEVFPKTSVYCNEPLKVAPQNSILMSVRAPVGTINKADQKYIIGRGLCSIVSLINNDYLYYYLLQNKNRLEQKAQGSTFLAINSAEVNDFDVSYPADLSTQRRIAAILASADKVIAATQKTIAKYKQIKQGMMEDLLNEQCTMNNVQWKKVKLGECCTIHGRIGFRGYTTDDLVEKGYGAITFSPSDIHNFKLCYDDCDYITWKKYEESPEIKVFNGDILFCKTASIGKCAYVEGLKEKATINPQFVVLKNFQCDSKFLFYKLISYGFQTQVQGITGGSTIKTMSQEKLSLEEITIPDLAAQRRIATILSSIEAKIEAEEKVLQKYEKVKKGLMERMLEDNK